MTEAEREIPAVLILVPFLVVATTLMVWRLRRRAGTLTAPRVLVGLLACAYAAVVLDAVLLPYRFRGPGQDSDLPWHVWINLVPLADDDRSGLWLNIALFVPLGIVLPFVLARASLRTVALAGFLASLCIEVIQLLGALTIGAGRVFDVDDLLANTLGCLVGYAFFRAAMLVPVARRVAGAATWPARARPGRPTGARRPRGSSRTSGRSTARR